MDLHKNARLSLRSREALVRKVIAEKQTLKAAAAAFSVSRKTAAKWVERYRRDPAPKISAIDHIAAHEPLPQACSNRWSSCAVATVPAT